MNLTFKNSMYFALAFLVVPVLVSCQSGNQVSTGLSSPASSSSTGSSRVQVIQATASSNTAKLEFYVNGALTCTVTSAPYNCSWNVPAGAGVQYSLQTKAYDSSGNTGVSSVVQVTSR